MSQTPGPWRLKRGDHTTIEAVDPENPDDPYVVAKTHTSPFAPQRPIAIANARLIAAAPELLAACEAAREWHEATSSDRTPQWDESTWERNGKLYGRWVALVKSAVTKARRGFTLIELLVVLVIIAIVSVLALPTVVNAWGHRQVSEGARLLQASLAGARDEAIRTNSPSGIRLLPDPIFNGLDPTTGLLDPTLILACNRIVPLSVPTNYTEGALSAYPPSSYAAAIRSVPCLVVEQAVFDNSSPPAPNVPTSWFWNIRVGEKIQVGGAGPWYTIVGPMVQVNPESFINIGAPGTALPTLNGGSPCEYLLLVNGRDDDHDGWIDEGFDGVDNDADGAIDEADEWEAEAFIGPVGASSQPYTIARRPFPAANAREINLPSNVVVDLTGYLLPLPERSRLPVNLSTGHVDLLVNPDGSVAPMVPYASPASLGMASSFFHFWVGERSDLKAIRYDTSQVPPVPIPITAGTNQYLPIGPTVPPPTMPPPPSYRPYTGPALAGQYYLVTVFARTGLVASTDNPAFDNPYSPTSSAYDPNFPFRQTEQGRP